MICYQDKDMQLDAMLDAFEHLLPLCWFLSYWFDWLVSAISAIQQLRWGSIGGYVSHVGPPLSLANLRDQPSGPRAFLRLPCLRASPRSWGLSWSCLSSARKARLSPLFSSSVVLLYILISSFSPPFSSILPLFSFSVRITARHAPQLAWPRYQGSTQLGLPKFEQRALPCKDLAPFNVTYYISEL